MLSKRYIEYLSVVLMLGENSPYLRDLNIYHMISVQKCFPKKDNIRVTEIHAAISGNKIDIIRRLLIPPDFRIETSRVTPPGISTIISFINKRHKIHISDTLYSQEEFDYNKNIWHKTLLSRIDIISTLITILQTKNRDDIPILLDDFPNISAALVTRPAVLTEGMLDVENYERNERNNK